MHCQTECRRSLAEIVYFSFNDARKVVSESKKVVKSMKCCDSQIYERLDPVCVADAIGTISRSSSLSPARKIQASVAPEVCVKPPFLRGHGPFVCGPSRNLERFLRESAFAIISDACNS